MRFRAPDPVVLVFCLCACFATVPAARGADVQLVLRGEDGALAPSGAFLAEDVFDPVFAFFLAVLDLDQLGHVDQAFLDSLATAEGGSKVPYRTITRMERSDIGPGIDARVRIELERDLAEPIPFSILGYNPGTVRASKRLDMLHWALGRQVFEIEPEDDDDPPHEVVLEDGHLFVLAEGVMEMDIDGWLDRLLGGRLDDVKMVGFYVFRQDGTRYGLGFGYNPKGRGRTGVFDFAKNESVFPGSRDHLSVGRQIRAIGEERLEEWKKSRSAAADRPVPSVPR